MFAFHLFSYLSRWLYWQDGGPTTFIVQEIMDLPGAFQTSAGGLLLTVPLSAPLFSFHPPPACCPPLTVPQSTPLSSSQPHQVQTSQPGLEIETSIYLSGLVLSDVDEQTLLDYVGSLIRDSMKKCFSAYWEEICNLSVLTA